MSVGGFPTIVDDDPNWYGWLIPRKAKWQNKCKTHIASEIQWLPWWFPQLYIIQIRYRMGEQHPPCFPHLMWTPGVTHIVYFNYCKLMKCDAIGKFPWPNPNSHPDHCQLPRPLKLPKSCRWSSISLRLRLGFGLLLGRRILSAKGKTGDL